MLKWVPYKETGFKAEIKIKDQSKMKVYVTPMGNSIGWAIAFRPNDKKRIIKVEDSIDTAKHVGEILVRNELLQRISNINVLLFNKTGV